MTLFAEDICTILHSVDDVEDKIPIVVHINVVSECVVCTTRSRDPSGGGINHLLAPHQHHQHGRQPLHHQDVFVIINTTCKEASVSSLGLLGSWLAMLLGHSINSNSINALNMSN